MTPTAITYRDPMLVRGILGYVAERCDNGRQPTWAELLDVFTSEDHAWRTIENVIYELAHFGAVQRHGHASKRNDTRSISITTLGRCWLEGTPPPQLKESE